MSYMLIGVFMTIGAIVYVCWNCERENIGILQWVEILGSILLACLFMAFVWPIALMVFGYDYFTNIYHETDSN